jgi:uncharacterized membrane protein
VSAAVAILVLWLAFGVTHIGMASARFRPRLVGVLGERGYQAVYSLVALATFISLVMVFNRNRDAGAVLWSIDPSPVLAGVVSLGMAISLVLMVAGLIAPSPASLLPGSVEPRGVHRITRHPLFMGLGLFGLFHLLTTGTAAGVLFFAGFPIFGVIACQHQDRRKLADADEALRNFYARTALIPFTGPETAQGLREFSRVALVIGIALTVVLRIFHGSLFG